MATAHNPNTSSVRRGITAGVLLLAMVGGMVLTSGAEKVAATSLFGGLRSAGQAAFVAGHRGDRSTAPENTMPALMAALSGPMDFVETDIQLTKDNVPVLMHDTFVDRTTNGQGRVRDFTFAQIQKLDAGAWYSPAFQGTKVPSLESLLSALKAKNAQGQAKKALLELKGFWSLDRVKIVTDLIQRYRVGHLVIVAGFDVSTIDNLHQADHTLPRAIITSTLPKDPVALAKLYGAIALIVNQSAIENEPWSVDRMHRAGIGVIVYTQNKKAAWQRSLNLGVDGIITDQPSRLDGWLTKAVGR